MLAEDGAPKIPQTIRIGQNTTIGPSEKCFIIAEIGQNHQGDIEMAKKMIELAKECGADCVKFQKTHLESKFNKQALLRPYQGPNSWGKTYGEHKKFLEFSTQQFIQLQEHAQKNDVLFSSSAMDQVSLMFLHSMNLPFIKIGSGDTHNMHLLKQAAHLNTPLIVSTGMSNSQEVVDLYDFLKSNQAVFCLLHCVSSYPTPVDEINLNVLKSYQQMFPDINIGYSGHELGIDIALAAVALGAKIIEKHFTLDKSLRGSDHICSLTPSEFKLMVQNIRAYENHQILTNAILTNQTVIKALGTHEKKFQNSEKACYDKLGKTLVAAEKLNAGDLLTWENTSLKVAEPKGIPANCLKTVIGKTVTRLIHKEESITQDDIS